MSDRGRRDNIPAVAVSVRGRSDSARLRRILRVAASCSLATVSSWHKHQQFASRRRCCALVALAPTGRFIGSGLANSGRARFLLAAVRCAIPYLQSHRLQALGVHLGGPLSFSSLSRQPHSRSFHRLLFARRSPDTLLLLHLMVFLQCSGSGSTQDRFEAGGWIVRSSPACEESGRALQDCALCS